MAKNDRHRILSFLVAITIATLLLVACQRQEDPPPGTSPSEVAPQPQIAASPPPALPDAAGAKPSAPVAVLLKDSVQPTLVEEQANALLLWRQFFRQKPVLLLFSGKALVPLPEILQADSARLLQQGDDRELTRRVAQPVPDLLLAADLGVAAAMHQGYFSKVIWVLPLEVGSELLPLADFKGGLHQRAAGWGDAIDSFVATEHGTYTGTLRGVPVEVVSIDRLPIINEPLLVHVDAGFFAAIYRNEIKTPLYPLLTGQLRKVAARGYRALGITISHDNSSFDVPLVMRSMGVEIASMLASPGLLEKPSATMMLREEIRYFESFYQPATIMEKSKALQKLVPRDADSLYSQYRAQRQLHNFDKGLAALDRAVTIDPVYALEYFELVNLALKDGEQEKALTMLDKAILALPEQALVKLRKAQLLIEMGRGKQARPLLNELKKLPWSEFYYPNIRQDIDGLLAQARQSG